LEVKRILKLEVQIPAEAFFNVVGTKDENLKFFEEIFGLKIFARGTSIIASGKEENLDRFEEFMEKVSSYFEVGHVLMPSDIRNLAIGFKLEKESLKTQKEEENFVDTILFSHKRKPIMAKTPTQKLYVETIKQNDITFGIGPAGTGKTYLAMAVAVSYLKQNKVNRIILQDQQ